MRAARGYDLPRVDSSYANDAGPRPLGPPELRPADEAEAPRRYPPRRAGGGLRRPHAAPVPRHRDGRPTAHAGADRDVPRLRVRPAAHLLLRPLVPRRARLPLPAHLRRL